jgi:hypothetical protein
LLAELQRRFARELWAGEPSLSVHRETTLSALTDALEASHPVCLCLVGEQFFRALARRFAREVPSRSPDLCDFGGELADHLARFEPARALPYLADVARLEWALHRARHAAPAEPLDPERIASAGARVTFRLAPGTALLDSPFPVDRIWEANQPGASDSTVSLDEGGAHLVVARESEGPRFTRVSRAELALLSAFARGESLERAASVWATGAESLGSFLARAAGRRWLSASA